MIARALELGPLVLASSSPRRRDILALLGIEFTVVEPDYEEDEIPGLEPAELAVAHARGKAAAVRGDCVLGVDTLVALDGRVFQKPADAEEARAFLRALSGRTHTVHSGLCLRVGATEHLRGATSGVTFAPLSDADVEWYVATGEWHDRAGGYAVQGRGAALVRSVDGDFQNVVGLPVPELLDAMAAAVESGS
ncbi:MAG TPA: Maf family protein [Gaiellales bacterium]